MSNRWLGMGGAIAMLLVYAARDVAAAPARFHRAKPISVAKLRLSSVVCTLDGDPLTYSREVMHAGIVVAPDGGIVILDGAGRLRRYRAARGAGCALRLDHTFGKDGVLALGAGATADFATLGVDRDGTLYVSAPRHTPWRIHGADVRTMTCDDDVRVNASPLSDYVWRHQYGSTIVRERGDCSDAAEIARHGWDGSIGQLWAIDDRAVAYGKRHDAYVLAVIDGDAKEIGALPTPTPDQPWDPMRVVRCGSATCAINSAQLAIWSAAGALLGATPLADLLGVDGHVWPIDLAGAGRSAYVLVEDNDPEGDESPRAATLVRVDGLPR